MRWMKTGAIFVIELLEDDVEGVVVLENVVDGYEVGAPDFVHDV